MILVWILLQISRQIIHQLFGRNFHPPPGSVTSRETIPPLIISFLGDLAPPQRADIHLAVGLPLTLVSEQKDRFRKYLIQREEVKFSFDGTAYSIRIVGCDVFPQGFVAVADKLAEFKGTTMLCDIGNGTMNIMTISNGKPNPQKCYMEKYGTYQCMLSIREQLMRKFGTAIDDDVIDDALRYGTADISEKYLTVIREVARQYVAGIMRRLREHEYNPELMKLYIVGGGRVPDPELRGI